MSNVTLIDRIRQHEVERGEAPALRDPQQMMSWAELGLFSNRVANALMALGLEKGDRVAFLGHGSVRYAATLVGTLKAGLSLVPLPTLLSDEAIGTMLADSGAKVLFVSESQAAKPRQRPAHTIGLDFADDETKDFDAFLDGASDTAPDVTITLEDEFNVIYSSGTTGTPKGIVLQHKLRADAARRFRSLGFPDGGRTLATTAIYSNWTIGAFVYTLWAGGCLYLTGKFSAAGLVELCEDYRPDDIFMVPIQAQRLLDYVAQTDCPAPPPALKWCAGSYFPAAQKAALMDYWDGGLMEIYGLTEGAPFTMLNASAHPDKIGTVGRSDPVEDLKIIGENDQLLPNGERGEVLGRVRVIMRGYHNNPAASEAMIWRDEDGTAWMRSGDIGWLDDDGFLTITGRKKDMIVSGGFNIYSADLEEILLRHPDIAEAAAFAVPSAEWGESPAAAIVPREGAELNPDAIRQWANDQLGPLQRIRAVALTPSLPRGSLDKVLYRSLRDQFAHLGDSESKTA